MQEPLVTVTFGKLVAAICAAPSILGHMGLLRGRKATCYPGFEKDLIGCDYQNSAIVVDENIITAKGAGTVFEFAFAIVDKLTGSYRFSKQLRESMQCTR